MQQNHLFLIWEFCVHVRKVTDFALVGVFLQDGAQEEQHSKTKQESAWLFRLWYTFDHKYPFQTRLYNTESSVYHYFLVRRVFQQLRLRSFPSRSPS